MAVSDQNSSDSSFSVTKKTPLLGLKLYVVILLTIAVIIFVFALIFLCLRSSRRRRAQLRYSSGLLPLVTKEITEIKTLDDHIKLVETVECEKKISSNLSGEKKGNYTSNESSTSQSESVSVSVLAESVNIGWGRWYTLKELETATFCFAVENVIGEGGYGVVYRGVLSDGSVVAVKNLMNNKWVFNFIIF